MRNSPKPRKPRVPRRKTEQEQHQAIVDAIHEAPPAKPVRDIADLPEAKSAEQIAQALHAQVATARNAFFRLATVRGADLVRNEGKGWDEAGAYINAEMAGLDAQLAAIAPK